VLAARKTDLITARARKNKRTAHMLASARKDHSIPLLWTTITVKDFFPERKLKKALRDTLTRAAWYGLLSKMANWPIRL